MSRRQRGFSLLEAIVALVIFSMVAMALYDWQGGNLRTMQRAEAHAQHNALVRSALGVLADVNPMRTPGGERAMGELTVRWTSTLVQPRKGNRTAVGLPGDFDVGLYLLDVQVLRHDHPLAAFQVRQVGYRQVRSSGAGE